VLIEQARTGATVQEEALRIADRYRNGATSELDVWATTLLESTRTTIRSCRSACNRLRMR
jgi:hypothetical protein